MAQPFVHLHVHSEYSILDGACRIPALVEKATRLEMPAVALTDHGSLAGAVELHREARQAGIKPVIGCEVYVADDRRAQTKGYAHLTLLAESNEGYANLIKLSSLAYLEGYYYKPRVDWELLQGHAKGLIALSGCLSGRVSRALVEERPKDAREDLDRLVQIFGRDSTYVELQNAGLAEQQLINPGLIALAEETGLPLVATGDVHYLDAEDAYAHEALLCIQSGDTLKNPNHWRFDTNEFFFKTPEEMAGDFPGLEHALARTLEVAERCNVEIELGRILLPTYPLPEGRDAFDYLVELCEKGLVKRYGKATPELTERLRFELKTVREMGFADYFLIVWDFIGFARRSGIGVGPGRGSAAGSLVAYCLEITDIDPIRYDLLFERFLNPGRKSMPDIDIDFAVEGRDRVINYVAEKYGRDRVAQIITFSTMAARAAIRDAGRVLDIPYGVVDRIAKLVPEGPGQTLEDSLRSGTELRQAVDSDPVAKEIVELARPLEGLARADSIHAAGVVIGAQALIETVPLQQKGADQEVVTQFAMGDVEALGLLKMDFLGLRNLDVIDKAVGLVGGVDIGSIPLDDPTTYAMLSRGESTGVFQFESSGMREALRLVKPSEFEDLVALVALYRPGPMAYIPTYAARKHGREQVTFADPRLEQITGPTHGTCLTGDSLVFDAASGRRVRIDELHDFDEVVVQGVDDDLSPVHARITAWRDNGVRPVFVIKLRSGVRIKATADHEFLTEDGWRRVDQLSVGEFLATPRKLSTVREGRWLDTAERARFRVLAHLLGDGSLSQATACFFSANDDLRTDFERACAEGFDGLSFTRHRKARGVVQVCPVKDRAAGLAYHSPSTLEMWLREKGLRWPLRDERARGGIRRGPRSAEKWIPEEIFELGEEEIARFLAALWDCDGHIGLRRVSLTTISERLALDVQALLLRIGIRSALAESRYEAHADGRPDERVAYHLLTYGTARFAELVQPFMITDKGRMITATRERGLPLRRAAVLAEIRGAVSDLEPAGHYYPGGEPPSLATIATRAGISAQHFSRPSATYERIELSSVVPATDALQVPDVTGASRVAWREIASIAPAGEERVYDVTVERIHNFIVDGVIAHNCLFQEQFMEIAKQLAGFSPAEADDLRKAIGKKIHSLMASLKEKFIEGCIANGVADQVAKQLWDDTEKSQDYSFNKSHAACYALIAYRTAWLKANHPREYMAALISSVMNTKDRVPYYVNACREMGIDVLPPDVNSSQQDFAVVGGVIHFGLNAVKNVGEAAAEAIVRARAEGGPFDSIWEFTERVDPRMLNRRALEALIRCGALDSTGATRMGMLAETILDSALSHGQRLAADRLAGQASIFDGHLDDVEMARERHHPTISTQEFDEQELLRLEKETLGIYVSEHPLERVRGDLRRKTDCALMDLERRRDGDIVTVGGIVSGLKQVTTKRGDPMVFVTLEDPTSSAEVVVFNSTYAAARDLLEADRILVVKGRVDHKQAGETKLIAIEVSAFEAVQVRREVRLRIDARQAPAGLIRELATLVSDFPGEAPVYVALETSVGERTLALGPEYRVKPDADFFAEVRALLGEAAVV